MKKKIKKGEMVWATCENIVALKWKDKRDVYAISNAHSPEMVLTTNRHGQEKMKPNIIKDYNENMSSIDLSDQMSYHSATRKTVRWYKKIGLHVIEMLLTNAHYLFTKYSGAGVKVGVADFKETLIKNLVGPLKKRTVKRGRFHYLVKIPAMEKKKGPTRQCGVCNQKGKESRYVCAFCVNEKGKNVPLHVDNYFRIYHSRMMLMDQNADNSNGMSIEVSEDSDTDSK